MLLIVWASAAGQQPASDRAASLPIDPPAEQALLQLAGPGFVLQRTDHFVIATDADVRTIKRLTDRAERTYQRIDAFRRELGLPEVPPRSKLQIIFFGLPEDFAAYAINAGFDRGASVGFYDQRTNIAAFVTVAELPQLEALDDRIEALERRIVSLQSSSPIDRRALKQARQEQRRLHGERQKFINRTDLIALQHEVAHQVFFNVGVHRRDANNPGWLVEGLACLFEVFSAAERPGPAVNQARLGDLRDVLTKASPGNQPSFDGWRAAVQGGALRALSDLIGEARVFEQRQNANLPHLYSEAWALVFYLHRTRPEPLAEYVRRTTQRAGATPTNAADEIALFESVFGRVDEGFEQDFVRFLLQLRYEPE